MSTLPKCLKRHTTEIDPKQTHVIDDKVELSFRVSQPTKVVCNAVDHNTAFTMYTKALGFVFTQRREEFTDYQTFLGRLFLRCGPSLSWANHRL